MDSKIKTVSLILRLSLGFAFIYAAISHYFSPDNWLQFYPDFMQEIASENWYILLAFLGELAFGLMIISGRLTYYLAILSALALSVILVFNLDQMFILFRDVSLIGASIALAVLHSGEHRK